MNHSSGTGMHRIRSGGEPEDYRFLRYCREERTAMRGRGVMNGEYRRNNQETRDKIRRTKSEIQSQVRI